MPRELLFETINSTEAKLSLESDVKDGGLRQITAIGLKADFLNKNMRRYPRDAVIAAVVDANNRMKQGEQILSIAPSNSPLEKEHTSETKYFNVNVNWNTIEFDDSQGVILLKGLVSSTAVGEELLSVLESGIKLGISMVSEGLIRQVTEPNGRNGRLVREMFDFKILRFDVVLNQSDKNAKILSLESKETVMTENEEGSLRANEQLQADTTPSEAESKFQLAQATLEKQELQRKITEFERREEKRKIVESLNKEVAGWTYPIDVVAALRRKVEESLGNLGKEPVFNDYLEILQREKLFTESLIRNEQRGRGLNLSQGSNLYGIVVNETPIHAGLSTILMEAAVKHGFAHEFGRNEGMRRSEQLSRNCLELFDLRFRPELEREYRRWQEATTLGDVKGIFSAARFILAQGYALAKAPNVFDVQALGVGAAPVASWVELIDDTRLVFTVAAEAITSSKLVLNTPYPLAHKNIIFDLTTLIVTGGGVFGTDHVVDANNGTYTPLTATGLGASSIAYQYKNFSPGDGLISMRKAITHQEQLTFKHITLGYNISRDALVASKQSYGNEHQMAVLKAITNELVLEKDTQLFNMAVAKAGMGPGNLVGTFTLATDPPSVLAGLIGDAMGKLEGPGRNLTATAIVMGSSLMSVLSQYMSNRTAAPLNGTTVENGQVTVFNGVPVHRVNTMPDNLVMVLDRELVLDRIKSPVFFVVSDAPGVGYDATGSLAGTPIVGYTSTSTSILAEESCSVATVSNKATYIKVV